MIFLNANQLKLELQAETLFCTSHAAPRASSTIFFASLTAQKTLSFARKVNIHITAMIVHRMLVNMRFGDGKVEVALMRKHSRSRSSFCAIYLKAFQSVFNFLFKYVLQWSSQ